MNVAGKSLSLIFKKALFCQYSQTKLVLINIRITRRMYTQVTSFLYILTLNRTLHNKEQMCHSDSRRAGTRKVVSLKVPWDKCSALDTH